MLDPRGLYRRARIMALKTQLLTVLPWNGSVNLAVNPGLIAKTELVQADNLVFDSSSSRKKREGIDFDWDEGNYQLSKITTVADSGGSLDGTYFILYDTNGSVGFWFDVNNSGTTIPSGAASADRAVEITTVTTGMTAAQVATQVQLAIDADSEFSAWVGGSKVFTSVTTNSSLTAPDAGDSGFTLSSEHSSTKIIVDFIDFWYDSSNVKTQRIAALTDDGDLALYQSDGTRSWVPDSGTAWTGTITQVSFLPFNNKLLVAVNGLNNKIKIYDPALGTFTDLSGSPVNASILQEHLGRVFYNDKSNKDRLYYTEIADETIHNGNGDSGAIDIKIGDGDPFGINGLLPPFKGVLFIGKRGKLYRLDGYNPEEFEINTVSDGIGIVANSANASIDQDDEFFISERGHHSLAATNTYGDFASSFLSEKIQPKFSEEFSDLSSATGCYIPTINSYAFTILDDEISSTNKVVWLYNIPLKIWYRWYPSDTLNISLSAVRLVLDGTRKIPFFGTNKGRLAKGFTGTFNDTSLTGGDSAIQMTIKTGFIFADDNPYTIKAFKRLGIIYAPVGGSDLNIGFKIDNFEEQTFTIEGPATGATLGSGSANPLILNQSVLGGSFPLAPQTISIEGYGRGFQLTLTQTGVDENVDIQGFQVEYQGAGTRQVTDLTIGSEDS